MEVTVVFVLIDMPDSAMASISEFKTLRGSRKAMIPACSIPPALGRDS